MKKAEQIVFVIDDDLSMRTAIKRLVEAVGLSVETFGSGKEFFEGNSAKPRLSVGIGVNWISPFGPLRVHIAKALLKEEGDETKFFSFNVGTQF